jgi:HlyD family secretion protein/macrolide-specific efflux system membrane fusion protein
MKIIKSIFNRIKNTRRRTKIIGIIIILFILFLLLRGKQKPAGLEYATVSQNNIESLVTASGVLSGKNVATLHFNSGGKLNYLPLKNGDKVLKGQAIASIDSTALNAAYQEAVNNYRNTQANVQLVHDQVKDHSGDETFEQKAARTNAEVANDNAYNAMLAAQQMLKDTTIYSPISGIVVVNNNLSVGQNITPSDTVAQVVDFSEKAIDATVDESDISKISVGQNANVTLNAYGDTVFKGTVSEVRPATQTDSTGAITITVKIKLTDDRIANIYGLNGNADIIVAHKENVLTIPQDALIDESHVYVKNGKSYEKREIQTGIKSDIDVEVLSGLSEGQEVVTNPQVISK